ncbi:MAG: 3-deoxy-D-manno-octulosonic acid transferase [Acinetobacter sp.]
MATPFWYNTALALIKPFYLWRIKKRAQSPEAYQQECLERFGPFETPQNRQAIWFHAASVGETNAAQPLIEHYLRMGHAVLVTNTTKTGQARAKSLFAQSQYAQQFQAVYVPVDQKKILSQFFALYEPKLLALIETELWPNLIAEAQQREIPCLLLNARLSEKSAKGYEKIATITQTMLQQLTWVLAQDQDTLCRYLGLGLEEEKCQVVGNIKFDIQTPSVFLDLATQLRDVWQLKQRQIFTIASSHAPEEQQLLQQLQPHLNSNPELLCIVVPRHPERFDDVFQICHNLNLNTVRRSLNEAVQPETQVYVADSMGELWLWYALSQVAFVGGSLNESGGGHNVLEPMALNVPTITGHKYFNFQNIIDELIAENGILIAETAEQAVAMGLACLAEPEQAQQLAQQAQVVLKRNQGSLQHHIDIMDACLAHVTPSISE